MPRGRLLDDSTILLPTGEKVRTFTGCDAQYLADFGLAHGDFVAFEYLSPSNHATHLKKVRPTPKEIAALERVAPAETSGSRGFGEFLRTVARKLTELGFLHGASVDDVVARALRNGAADEEDAAYYCLIGSEGSARRFVTFDHHLDPELVSAIDNALEGERVRLELESHTDGESLTVKLSNADSETTRTVTVHSIAELVNEVDQDLAETRSFDEPNTNRQAFWLVCHEGSAVLFATDAEVATLVNAGIAEGSRDL